MRGHSGPDGVLQKSHCSLLLKLEPAVDGTAGVDQETKLERKVRLLAEVNNLLWGLVIVKNAKILGLQIAHELAVLVHGNEQNVNFIHALLYGDDRCRVGAFYISIDRGRGYGNSRGDIGLPLTRGRLTCEPDTDQETKDQTYVLHSRTIQKLHK